MAVDQIARGMAAEALGESSAMSSSLSEIFLREGDPDSIVVNNWGSPVTVHTGAQNTVVTSTLAVPTIEKIFYATQAICVLDTAGLAQFGIAADTNGRFNPMIYQGIMAANVPIIIPFNQMIRAFEVLNGVFSIAIRNNLAVGDVAYQGSIGLMGYQVTDDMNYSAAKVILGVGDSIWNGTGPTITAKGVPFLWRDYWNNRGANARIVLKSRSGSTTSDHEIWRKAGWYDIGQVDQLWYEVGPNDAANSVSPATSVANITAFWTWFSQRYPGKTFVLLSPGPLQNATKFTNALALAAAEAAWVASVNSPQLKFIDITHAFLNTDASFYAATDPGGDGVHPHDAGNAAEWTVIQTNILSQGITSP